MIEQSIVTSAPAMSILINEHLWLDERRSSLPNPP
jgi:hypothetical protein